MENEKYFLKLKKNLKSVITFEPFVRIACFWGQSVKVWVICKDVVWMLKIFPDRRGHTKYFVSQNSTNSDAQFPIQTQQYFNDQCIISQTSN